MFSWSLQVAVEKRAGAYAVFFTFVSRKIRLSFLVIPKKQIDPECDRIFVACFHCKYTYTAKVICVCNDNDIRWLICVLSGRCGRICCLGYLKRFMIETQVYENDKCSHHRWGVLFAHIGFAMGKTRKIGQVICGWFVINWLFDAYTGKQQTTMVFVCVFPTKMERFDSRKNWGSLGILQFHFARRLQI